MPSRPGRRHGIDVQRHQQLLGGRELRRAQDLGAGAAGGQDDLGVGDHRELAGLVAAVGRRHRHAEALAELVAGGGDPLQAVIADQRRPWRPPGPRSAPRSGRPGRCRRTPRPAGPSRSQPVARRCFSTTAIMPAAVVKAPDGSAMTEISKCGGTIACLAASSMSMASIGSRPPISTAVCAPVLGRAAEDRVLDQARDLLQVDVASRGRPRRSRHRPPC